MLRVARFLDDGTLDGFVFYYAWSTGSTRPWYITPQDVVLRKDTIIVGSAFHEDVGSALVVVRIKESGGADKDFGDANGVGVVLEGSSQRAFNSVERALLAYLEVYPKSMTLDPETRQLLIDMKGRGIPLGIVTNGSSESQRGKVISTGLDDLVDAVVISGDLNIHKPDRRIFERALAMIDADPSTTLFVGDNPDADILGAKGLGMQTAWIHMAREWPHVGNRPDHVIGHVSEVGEIVLD